MLGWLKNVLPTLAGRGKQKNTPFGQISVSNPLVIESPNIGFLNLIGPEAAALLSEDRAALAHLFATVATSDDDPPNCDVLFIYCKIEESGSIVGRHEALREIIAKSRSAVVVVAWDNDRDHYQKTFTQREYGPVNLVLTLGRNGSAFRDFYVNLFDKMSRGVSMPLAWVELAPQIPEMEHPNTPSSVFLAEISHIVFTVGKSVSSGPVFRLRVQYVFYIRPPVDRVVAVGIIESGSVRQGDTLVVQSAHAAITVTVESIEFPNRRPKVAIAGQQVGLMLRGVSKEQVSEGDVIANRAEPWPLTYFAIARAMLPRLPA